MGPCRGALLPWSLLVQAAMLAVALAQGTLPAFLPCEFQAPSRVNCEWLFLKSVPHFSAAAPRGNITSLSLRSNRIHHLHNSDFVHLSSLQHLDLKWNCPPSSLSALHWSCHMTIEPNTFLVLPTLEVLNLSYNNITAVPALPNSLRYLSLSRTNILELDHTTFKGLHALRHLYMDGNCYYKNPCGQVPQVAPGALLSLGNLTHLSLKYNNLTEVPRSLPPSLENLLLSYNRIVSLGPKDLANLTALRVLDVGGNCRRCDHARNPCIECPKGFPKLHQDTFRHLSHLEGLVLKDSSLYSLNTNWFRGLGNLSVLDLSENFLYDCITKTTAFKGLTQLRKLNLSFNYHKGVSYAHLSLAPSFASLLSLQELNMNGIFFRLLNEDTLRPLTGLPALQNLSLQMNFINRANLSIFRAFPSLCHVDLSNNRISGAPEGLAATKGETNAGEVGRLPFRGLAAARLEPPSSDDFMPSCKTLKFTLDLSRNNLVTVRPQMFAGLSRLQCLRLSHNSISQAVNGSEFVPLTSLQVLDLSHNKLDLYHGRSFTELPRLQALDLSFNSQPFSMQGVGHNLSFVAQLTSLRYLSLAHNSIHSRVSQKLCSTSLLALDFSGNDLNRMWNEGDLYLHFFQGLTHLVRLDLSQNHLHALLPHTLDNLPKSLQMLRLRDNYLAFFNWSTLSILPKLEALDLAGNLLKALTNGSLPVGTRLQRLDLSDNSISSVASGFFAQATKLRVLNLSANALKTVEPSWFGTFRVATLKVLDVSANPLHCACGEAFVDFLLEVQAAVPGLSSRVRCGSPGQLLGRSIFAQDLRLCLDEGLAWVCFGISVLAVALGLAVPTLHHLCGWDLWYCFHLGLAWLPRWGRQRGADALSYDAFVVFDKTHGAVDDWVYNELRVQLEERRGRRALRLCLEERDWLPGKSLFENLWDSIYSSRKTLFVLAHTDRVSGLLRASFLLAQQRLLEDRKDVVVLVILSPSAHRSRYVRLRQRLCRQSVLFWPHQPSGQGSFWAQLGTALTRDNHHFYNRNFCRGPTTAE